MIEGKTKSGFEFRIEDEALNDMELLDLLGEIDSGNVSLLGRTTEKLLGKEQKQALYEHLRTDRGNVPLDKFVDEITEILNSKNS